MSRVRQGARAARRILLFTGVPALGAFSPLIVLPALTRALGAPGWASLAVAQAAGTFGALFVNWAWNVQGPSLVAAADEPGRVALYSSSLRGRAISAAVALPIAGAVAFAVAPAYRPSAALMAVAVSLSGALPSWYFVGTGAPIKLAAFDAAPRVAAAAVSALLLAIAPSDWIYPVVLLAVTVMALGVAARLLTGSVLHLPSRADFDSARTNLLLVLSGLISSGYTTLTIPVVAVVAPGAVPVFAAASRFQGYGSLALSAITNAGQAWVSAHGVDTAELARRRVVTLVGNSLAGFLAGALLAASLPVVSHLLFSGEVDVTFQTSSLVGGIVFMIAVSMSTTFHLLVPSGRTRTVATSGLVTSAVGVPLLVWLATVGGAGGALTAILIAETISSGIQLAAYFWPRSLRRRAADPLPSH